MANIIQDVINLDLEASEKVAKIRKEREQLKSFFDYERKSMVERFTKEMNEHVHNYQKEVESDIDIHRLQAKEHQEAIKARLKATFDQQKQAWIEEIFNHCIG
ncbi:MAG: hypothetical protein PHY42_03020 [Bacilli bacterium]|nr:hypothetical protein [Bacilli bacterium]